MELNSVRLQGSLKNKGLLSKKRRTFEVINAAAVLCLSHTAVRIDVKEFEHVMDARRIAEIMTEMLLGVSLK